jgi:hypothetical protein
MRVRCMSRIKWFSARGGGKQFKQLRAFRKCRLRKFIMGKLCLFWLWPTLHNDGPSNFSKRSSRLLCLQHYVAASSGWDCVSRCHVCTDVNQDCVRQLTGCVAPIVPCSCRVGRRQPPTLRNLAFNIHRFEVT